jgi:hypothetical protein
MKTAVCASLLAVLLLWSASADAQSDQVYVNRQVWQPFMKALEKPDGDFNKDMNEAVFMSGKILQ